MNTPLANTPEDDLLGSADQEHDNPVEGQNGTFQDLLVAAQSTLEFWDNPMDDEDWNGTYIKVK
jgi:hypothetical protein